MSYNVDLSKSAKKFLGTLTKTNYLLIVKHLLELEQNPHPSGSVKLSNSNYYRHRAGNYRIIYEVKNSVLLVHVLTIGHRKDVYKK